jgi:hypothetical protein
MHGGGPRSRLLNQEVDKLKRAYANMKRKVEEAAEAPASSKFTLPRMECGSITDFHRASSHGVREYH